ncbi:M15 family metallopeptidase [Curtobacterium sp. NPDC089185]|uniref:M15 family metallopeptidase n=1 Tax=Curtobacterium sp. NPDC089185 TaxID=3154968 RepID=UPI0034467764
MRKAAGYASGGIVGAGKDILSGVIDTTRNVASLASDLVTDLAGTIGKAVKSLIGKIPGAGAVVDLAGGFGRKVLDGAMQSLQNLVGSFLPAGGTGANGSIPGGELGKAANYRPGGGVGPMGGYLRAPAAAAWNAMVAASGNMLTLTEGYRDLASQQYRWARYKAGRGNLAAAPGTSIHGYGLAADIGAGQAWARANGARFGWHPTGLSFSQREPWHFEYKGAKAKGYAAGGIVGGLQSTLYDKGGVLPRGLSLVQNNLRDPEIALPMKTLQEVVAGADSRGGDEIHIHNEGKRDFTVHDYMEAKHRMDVLR